MNADELVFAYKDWPTPNITATSGRVQISAQLGPKCVRARMIVVCIGWEVLDALKWKNGDRVNFLETEDGIYFAKDHGQFKVSAPSSGKKATISFTGRYLSVQPETNVGRTCVDFAVLNNPNKPGQMMLVLPNSQEIFGDLQQWQ